MKLGDYLKKKKLIIIISIIVVLIFTGIIVNNKLYKSYKNDIRIATIEIKHLAKFFGFELKNDSNKKSSYADYLWKTITFQKIGYDTLIPQMSLSKTEKTNRQIANFNNNLFKNPRFDVEKSLVYGLIDEPGLTTEDFTETPQETYVIISELEGRLNTWNHYIGDLTNSTYP